MSLARKIAGIRHKPRRVRERILFVTLAVIAAGLVAVWYLTYHFDPIDGGSAFVKDIAGSVSKSFSDPAYQKTFGTPSLEAISGRPEAPAAQ